MEYSIRELSELAGVSARTLRYYDEIELLKPVYVSEAGYRYYSEKELELLQQILFYRERNFDLKSIKKILYQDGFDIMTAMEEHLLDLENQRERIDSLIHTVKQTILAMKGECKMTDQEKFEAFKEQMVRENEEKYGDEIRGKYGSEEVDVSHQKILNMSEEDWECFQSIEKEIRTRLEEGVRLGMKPDSEEAKRIVILHKEWLGKTWKAYKAESHKAIAAMYIADERFQIYYDKCVPGCARLLEQSIRFWADKL